MSNNRRLMTLSKVLEAHADWRKSSGMHGTRAVLTKSTILDQPFTNQNFSFADFDSINLADHTLEDSDLSYADLSKCKGLIEEKLAGTNLRGAILPPSIKDFAIISQIAEASKNANTILLTFLAAVLFTILTVFQATDAALFVNSSGAKLSPIQVDLPMAYFYIFTPFFLLSLYVYLNINTVRLWSLVRSLPEIFADGFPIYTRVYPWFFWDFIFCFTNLNIIHGHFSIISKA